MAKAVGCDDATRRSNSWTKTSKLQRDDADHEKEAREGRALPFAIEFEDEFVGQLTVGGIWGGSSRGAFFGYWIDERVAGRGLMTQCIELAADYCF